MTSARSTGVVCVLLAGLTFVGCSAAPPPVILPDADCATIRAQLHADPGARITVDLESNRVTGPDGTKYAFAIPEFNRHRLLNGLDDIAMTLELEADIAACEARRRAQEGWLFR